MQEENREGISGALKTLAAVVIVFLLLAALYVGYQAMQVLFPPNTYDLSLKLTMCGTDDNTVHINPMVLAFSPLLIPCCDVVRVDLHRVRNGKNPSLPDKNHIHHKLLAVGMQQRSVMIIVISVSTVFILFNILLSLYLNVNWIVLVDIPIWTFTNIRLTKRIGQLQSRQATNK